MKFETLKEQHLLKFKEETSLCALWLSRPGDALNWNRVQLTKPVKTYWEGVLFAAARLLEQHPCMLAEACLMLVTRLSPVKERSTRMKGCELIQSQHTMINSTMVGIFVHKYILTYSYMQTTRHNAAHSHTTYKLQ